jgi:hypothetical protein
MSQFNFNRNLSNNQRNKENFMSKKIKWILSVSGILSIAFSVLMLFSPSVFAACSATAGNYPDIKCELSGAGTCTSTANCVTCTPAGQQPGLPRCGYGSGEGDY